MSFKITIQNAQRLSRRMLEKKAYQAVISLRIARVADLLLRAAKAAAPRKSGKLEAGLHKKQTSKYRWEIREREKYGYYQREGTGARTITPRRKKALYWPGAEHPVAYVYHPGNFANPYHWEAVRDAEGDIEAEAEGLGKLVIEEVIK